MAKRKGGFKVKGGPSHEGHKMSHGKKKGGRKRSRRGKK